MTCRDSRALLGEMNKLFANFECNARFDSLNTTMSNMLLQNTEIQKPMKFLSKKYNTLLERLDKFKRENNALKRRIFVLENTADVIECNACSAMLEVRNISNSDSENKNDLTEIVQSIGSVLKQPVVTCDIKDIHRHVNKTNKNAKLNTA